MSLEVDRQEDYSAGAFPGMSRIPANGVEDITDGLLTEDGAIARRGGFAAVTDALSGPYLPHSIVDAYFPAVGGRRTVFTLDDYAATEHVFGVVDGSTMEEITRFAGPGSIDSRPVFVGGMVVLAMFSLTPDPSSTLLLYGGASGSWGLLSAGTVAVTRGSRTVTGTGSNFSGATPGAILKVGTTYAVIESIQSNTSLTLLEPWPYTTASGAAYTIQRGHGMPRTTTLDDTRLVLGAAGGRLLIGYKDSLYMSEFTEAGSGASLQQLSAYLQNAETDVQKLPSGGAITGIEPLGDAAYVFTTTGLFVLTGVAFEIVDAYGNAQQSLEQVGREMRLWGDRGLRNWQGQLVVPALDDLWLVGPGGARPIGGGGQRRYREYVRAGYQPGFAEVFEGHYVLPIVSSSEGMSPNVEDLLVWKLDGIGERGGAPFLGSWTARVVGASMRVEAGYSRAARLYGLTGPAEGGEVRVVDLAECFAPSAATSADVAPGVAHDLEVTVRTYSKSMLLRKWRRFRARLELVGGEGDGWEAEVAVGKPGSAFEALSGTVGAGDVTRTWTVDRAAQQIRFRLRTSGAVECAVLRGHEVFVRGGGRS